MTIRLNVIRLLACAVVFGLLALMAVLDEHDQCDAATVTCEATTPGQR